MTKEVAVLELREKEDGMEFEENQSWLFLVSTDTFIVSDVMELHWQIAPQGAIRTINIYH